MSPNKGVFHCIHNANVCSTDIPCFNDLEIQGDMSYVASLLMTEQLVKPELNTAAVLRRRYHTD